ncbi:hypothetical protein G7Z17_g7415 [Cylindrodendrum hubeiense]|uniref:Uncharacterized protein n=1 Tax=Cylindrodendrum hubeiense TaxID=595255 RepID=A0A9P5LFS5_9HYPO|nr:hypothetical protein G7Z17_g7415 [Cylindrodendrum hubeiense]
MAGESGTSPKKSGLGFHTPRDDVRERLLDPLEQVDPDPKFTLDFSFIQVLRLLVIPFAISDCVVIGVYNAGHEGWAFFFGSWTIALIIWTAFSIVRKYSKSDRCEFKLGNFVCFCGRIDKTFLKNRKERPYHIMLVDFVFVVLFIILSVLAFATDIWRYSYYYSHDQEKVGALSIVLASLQLALTVLNFFSLFRRVKIMIFANEHEDGGNSTFTVGEIYIDDQSEPRTSMASLV